MAKTPQSQLSRRQSDSALSADEIYQLKRKAYTSKHDDDWSFSINRQQFNQLDQQHRWAIEIIGNLIYK